MSRGLIENLRRALDARMHEGEEGAIDNAAALARPLIPAGEGACRRRCACGAPQARVATRLTRRGASATVPLLCSGGGHEPHKLLGETRKIMERVLGRESRVVGLRVHGRELREALLGCPEFGSFVAVCAARRGAPEIGEAELRHVLGLLEEA